MTKRGSTNLPQKSKPNTPETPTPQPRRLLQEYKSKAEREAVLQRYLILGVIAALGIAVLLLLGAFIVDGVITPAQTVATVNGRTITVREFETRVRLERALINEQLNQGIALFSGFGLGRDEIIQQLQSTPPYSTYLSEIQVSDTLGNRVLNQMVEDVLVQQEAERLGISVTDEEVQTQVNEYFGFDPERGLTEPTATPEPSVTPTPFVSPTPSPVPTSTPTPEFTPTPTVTPVASNTPTPTPNPTQAFETFTTTRNDFYGIIRGSAGVSDADIDAYFRMQALRTKVRDTVLVDFPRTAPFVNVRHILVDSQERAQNILDSLNAGDSFAELARAASTDTGSGQQGGELGWGPADRYVTPFADAIRDADIGPYIGPVETEFGFHVIQVRGREDREQTDNEFEQAIAREFESYIENLRAGETTAVEIFDIWTDNVPTDPRFVARGL